MDANSSTDLTGGGISIGIPTAGGGGGKFSPPRGYTQSVKVMLSAIVVLFAAVLIVLFLHLYLSWRLRRLASLRRRTRRRLVFASAPTAAAAAAPRGIDTDTLNSLPILSYMTRAEEGREAVECAVCINELEDGEKVRILPRCGHRFHIECIDMWFHSHATCPLCRSTVEPMEKPPPPPPPPSESLQPLNLIGSSSAGVREIRIEMPSRRGVEDSSTASPSGIKSPSRCIGAIRRLLSRDSRLCRDGGSAAETDLEMRDETEQPPQTQSL